MAWDWLYETRKSITSIYVIESVHNKNLTITTLHKRLVYTDLLMKYWITSLERTTSINYFCTSSNQKLGVGLKARSKSETLLPPTPKGFTLLYLFQGRDWRQATIQTMPLRSVRSWRTSHVLRWCDHCDWWLFTSSSTTVQASPASGPTWSRSSTTSNSPSILTGWLWVLLIVKTR